MKKTAITSKQNFRSNFSLLYPAFALNVLLFGAIVYIISCIVWPHQIKAGRIISLSAAVTESENTITSAGSGAAGKTGQWQNITMRVTGYCACPKCCGSYSDGITASGHRIKPGDVFVAADKKYTFGTEMIIEGYNNSRPVKVLDRGGVIHGDRLDTFFGSHDDALEWGVRYIDVKIRQD